MSRAESVKLRRSLALITAAGCLAMVYIPCISSAIVTDYLKEAGFQPRHIGILQGAAMMTVVLQFVGAFLSNRLRARKPAFMVLLIGGRVIWLGVVMLAIVLPGMATEWRILLMVLLIVATAALGNLGVPIWLSWMGDLIPSRILNRYWGQRFRWLFTVSVIVGIGLAVTSYVTRQVLDVPLVYVFAATVVIGVVCGVIDIVLFIWIAEPQNARTAGRNMFDLLAEPFRHSGCRSFVVWSSAFSASAMFAASFMIFYLLKEFKMPQWQAVVVSAALGTGFMISGKYWGTIADRHGHRPLLVLCSALKPLSPLVFFLITPKTAIFILVPFFVFDSCLNAGMQVAQNGYILKVAPQKNRGMFIAAAWSVPSIAGGIGAWLGGEMLTQFREFSYMALGREWGPYHLVFLISAGLRLACLPLARRIQEPKSSLSRHVLVSAMGQWPLRLMAFPVGIYQRFLGNEEKPADE